jgi:energy-coupling factor transporter transmembrane protein EcfT
MNKITKFLIFLIVVVVLIVVATAVFIGAGYLLSLILPLTLFQSSIVCIGATFVAAFIISAITIILYYVLPFEVTNYTNDKESDKDDNDYENIEEESDNFSKRRFTVVDTKKVGRNEPCPCGSGKKYKYCCEKRSRE